jgi:ATP-binding cassette, subfamily C, bacterial CydCD
MAGATAAPAPSGAAVAADRQRRRGGLDRRLLEHARATRSFIAVAVALGSLAALLIVAQAWLIADIVAEAFLGGRSLSALSAPMAALLAVVLARALVAWATELAAARASAAAKSQLRAGLLERGSQLAAHGDPRIRTGELAILASRGIDALDGYFSLYLPQLLLAVIVPLTILAAVLADDWISALIIAATIPLIPIFMALVGAATRESMERQLGTLERLAGHFLDVVAGLPTLQVFGRARAQVEAIARVSGLYRERTLATLRITFLSSLILELVATVSVAIVAVAIGIRLLDGDLALRAGLFALVLAPEAYLPLRRLGANYHASAEGIAAAEKAFAVIEAPAPPAGRSTIVPDPAREPIVLEDVTLTYPGRSRAALRELSLSVRPGETLGVCGPSGCGKSTILAVLLGLMDPDEGSARIGDEEIGGIQPSAWHARLSWVPQRPHLLHATIAENVRLGRTGSSEEQVLDALQEAGLLEIVRRLPRGLDTVLGEGGAGLSAGERQRLALARAFLRDTPLMLLDEPTAGLDGDTERDVVEAVRRIACGRTVVLVAHRPALVDICDRVVLLDPPGAGEA